MFNTVNVSVLPSGAINSKQFQSKISTNYFTDFDGIPKFVWRGTRCSTAKIILTKDKVGKLLSDFMMYYKAAVTKRVIKEQIVY